MLSKEEKDKVKEMYSKGVNITQIAKELKVSRQTVHKIVKQQEQEQPTKNNVSPSKPNTSDIENDEDVVKLKKQIRMQDLKNELVKKKEEHYDIEERRELWENLEENWYEVESMLSEATSRGKYKKEHCKHKDADSYCLYWRWDKEYLGMRWSLDGNGNKKWHEKPSPFKCAFCHGYESE